jgi:hypothetical protein
MTSSYLSVLRGKAGAAHPGQDGSSLRFDVERPTLEVHDQIAMSWRRKADRWNAFSAANLAISSVEFTGSMASFFI